MLIIEDKDLNQIIIIDVAMPVGLKIRKKKQANITKYQDPVSYLCYL